jgi:hypothetical protein
MQTLNLISSQSITGNENNLNSENRISYELDETMIFMNLLVKL